MCKTNIKVGYKHAICGSSTASRLILVVWNSSWHLICLYYKLFVKATFLVNTKYEFTNSSLFNIILMINECVKWFKCMFSNRYIVVLFCWQCCKHGRLPHIKAQFPLAMSPYGHLMAMLVHQRKPLAQFLQPSWMNRKPVESEKAFL